MARKRQTTTPHSASSTLVEDRLRARHITYRLEPNFAIDEIAETDGNQVRLIEHRAPPDMVSRYAEQMRAGATLPAIVVNDRAELIDGNTRRLAAIKAGRSKIAAYVCSGLTALEGRSLSVELNQCHGQSMTDEEVHAFIASAVHDGQKLDTQAYARMTGVRPSTLERWKAQASFELRAKRAGLIAAQFSRLAQSTQAVLNGIRLTAVLVVTTELVLAAKMTVADTRKLVAVVNAAPSETAALRVVSDERDRRAREIRAIATGFAAGRRGPNRTALHVAALLKLPVGDLLQVRPDKRAEALLQLRELRDHLDGAIAAAHQEWGTVVIPMDDQDVAREPAAVGGTGG